MICQAAPSAQYRKKDSQQAKCQAHASLVLMTESAAHVKVQVLRCLDLRLFRVVRVWFVISIRVYVISQHTAFVKTPGCLFDKSSVLLILNSLKSANLTPCFVHGFCALLCNHTIRACCKAGHSCMPIRHVIWFDGNLTQTESRHIESVENPNNSTDVQVFMHVNSKVGFVAWQHSARPEFNDKDNRLCTPPVGPKLRN